MNRKITRLLYPKIPLRVVGETISVTFLGALIAGTYGVIHDQITYTISEEYFTRLKFDQFAYAAPESGSERAFAGRIGFLATWWVGALVAWVFARVAVWKEGRLAPRREMVIGFVLVFLTSAISSVLGGTYGWSKREGGHAQGWIDWMNGLGVVDEVAFMTVGYIHNGSYIGGVLGSAVGCGYLAWARGKRSGWSVV